ncbi:hypothetical protein [Acholeplasma laidlawii]|uniref:hypothetical protein n=1 Tax=Acholeplasma laidlawii TaxID=2148 RepID=UPI00253F75C6|nr:hypothetical protein QOL21_05565 [Acholeplasma laidlawii]
MRKESLGFMLMIASYLAGLINKVVLSVLSISIDVYINYVLASNIFLTIVIIIGLILIILDNKDDIFLIIASLLLIASPISSIITTWIRLGFSVETGSSIVLMAQSINFAPVITVVFLLSLYNRLNISGSVLTMTYIAISLINFIGSMILNHFIKDLTVELFSLFSNIAAYIYYIQTIIIIGVLVMNLKYALSRKQK